MPHGCALLLGGMVGLECVDKELFEKVSHKIANNLNECSPKDIA